MMSKKYSDEVKVAIIREILAVPQKEQILAEKYKIPADLIHQWTSRISELLPVIFSKEAAIVFPQEESQAIRFLMNLKKERKLFSLLSEKYNLTQSELTYVYQITQKKCRPTYGVIYRLRDMIPPVLWYYKETEETPQPIKFTPVHIDYSITRHDEFLTSPTVGHQYMNRLVEEKKLVKFYKYYQFDYNYMYRYLAMRVRADGVREYRVRPAYPFVDLLKEIIHPDYWYIYPDEVEDKKAIFRMANECIEKIEQKDHM